MQNETFEDFILSGERTLEIMRFHFKRIWKDRHRSEGSQKSLKDNIRGQRSIHQAMNEERTKNANTQ